MDLPATKLEVLVSGEQSGIRWRALPLLIDAIWDAGSDAEKFEVLAAIRKTFPERYTSDIPDIETRTPAEAGRGEGFTQLGYARSHFPVPWTVIVPAEVAHLRFVPRPIAKMKRFVDTSFTFNAASNAYGQRSPVPATDESHLGR
jgi:hypothetical protein